MDGLDGIFGKAVAIPFTAGQHALDVGSHPLEVLVEQGGGGHAVHIVVSKDNDGLLPVDGIEDAGTGLVHVGQEHGVGQLLLTRQQGQGLGRVGDAARSQNARQQARLFLLGGQRHLIFFLAPRLPIHRFHGAAFQLLGALLGNGRGQLFQGGAVQRLQVPGPVGRHNSPSPVRPSLASIPCSAAISLETSMATSESRLSYRLL